MRPTRSVWSAAACHRFLFGEACFAVFLARPTPSPPLERWAIPDESRAAAILALSTQDRDDGARLQHVRASPDGKQRRRAAALHRRVLGFSFVFPGRTAGFASARMNGFGRKRRSSAKLVHDFTFWQTGTDASREAEGFRQQDADGAFGARRAAADRQPARRSGAAEAARIRAAERGYRRAHHQRSAGGAARSR